MSNFIDIEAGSGVIRIQINEFKGKEYLDIRKFYKDLDTEELKPTRKGISMPLEISGEVLEKALNIYNNY